MKEKLESFLVKIPRSIANLGSYFIFLFNTIVSIFKTPFPLRECFRQAVKIGYESITVTVLTNFLMGAVISLQLGINMERILAGSSNQLGAMGLAIVTELGPVLTAVIVAGKTGSAMAAQIGTMKITEQIDALKTLSTDPIQYISVPRFLASLIVLPILTIIADFTGVFGGYLVAMLSFNQSIETFMETFIYITRAYDIILGLLKAMIFGAIISTTSSYVGFNTEGGAEGVGKSTTQAVVLSSMGILIADLIVAATNNISIV
ncbi:MAG: MlaE family ABC transporter permease [Spirochaetota bacterium]